LHWHLSDNQGFRVESKKFPRLTGMGSDGQFYTQDEVRDLIAYAHDRGIRVVPEFDMPGHCTAWFAGYPELASGPGPYGIERGIGLRPAFPDNLPHIGRVGGALYVNGLYRHGFLLAPALARRAALALLEGQHFAEVMDENPRQRRLA
jgi:glycine/D-amino acid oxidase-like deaminating enzyme